MPTENRSSTELSKIVTEALVGMVTAVTGMKPPTDETLPGFIQAPIDRAVTRISGLLAQPAEQHNGDPVGEVVAFGKGLHEIAWAAGRMPGLGAKLYTHPAPVVNQGEPVVPKLKKPSYTPTPCRFGGKDGYYQVGGALVYDSLAEAQAAADRKNAELAQRYYEALEHADPGEVERLRETLDLVREQRDNELRTSIDLEKERDTLLAKLAERDAQLRDKSGDLIRMAAHLISAPLVALQDLQDEDKKMTRARVGHAVDVADARLKDAAYELRRIADALSASAEPSAPIAWHVGGNGYDRICFEEPRDLPGHPCVQTINDQHQLISLLKRYNLRDEEPSAPVERDERAEFELPHYLKLSDAMREAGERAEKRAIVDGCYSVPVLKAVFFEAAIQHWLDEQEEAGAALERDPHQHLELIHRLHRIGTHETSHVLNGSCPDEIEGHAARDNDCPACQALMDADELLAARSDKSTFVL